MTRYRVTVPVFSTVTVTVEASSEEEAKQLSVDAAIEAEPMVSWEVDEMQDFNVEEVRE